MEGKEKGKGRRKCEGEEDRGRRKRKEEHRRGGEYEGIGKLPGGMFLNAKPLFQGEALEVMENSKNCRVQGQHITSQVGTNEPGHPLTDTIAA